MGERVRKPRDKAAAQAEQANDLEVLHPNRKVTIAGREVEVREYGFIEGMKLLPTMQPFLADLKGLIVSDQPLRIGDIQGHLGTHIEAITHAVAVSADVEEEWMAGLGQDDGMALLMLWWAVNGPFYVRSVHSQIAADRAVAKVGAGQTSTQS